jgi:lysophospholipase L1-like esterase
VDLNGAFLSTDDYTLLLTEDGLHPNSAGYEFMAETWETGLLNTF